MALRGKQNVLTGKENQSFEAALLDFLAQEAFYHIDMDHAQVQIGGSCIKDYHFIDAKRRHNQRTVNGSRSMFWGCGLKSRIDVSKRPYDRCV